MEEAGAQALQVLVLVVDDAQWGMEALSQVPKLVRIKDARLLIVVAARDEALTEEPEAAELLRELECTPGCLGSEFVGGLWTIPIKASWCSRWRGWTARRAP